MPFHGDDMSEIFDSIRRGEFECDKNMISDSAEDLIRKMLVLNPDKRITAL
jgi:serine/threonine protein kinase